MIRLRRKSPTPAPADTSTPNVPDYAIPGNETTKVAAPARLRALQMASRQPESPFDGGGATRVASFDEIRAQQSASARAVTEEHDEDEWFVLLKGVQQGPWSLQRLRELTERHDIDIATYVWRDGMTDWQRLGQVAPLRTLLTAGADANAAAERTAMMNAHDLASHLARVRSAMDEDDNTHDLAAPSPEPGDVFDESAFLGEPVGVGLSPVDLEEPVELGAATSSLGDTPFRPPVAVLSESTGANAAYVNAPPGEATRVFMATAGIYRRRRQNKVVGTAVGLMLAGLAITVALDVAGVYTIPGMGIVYEATGMVDPNVNRARERVDTKLKSRDITPEERVQLEALRTKLLGTGGPTASSSKRVAQTASTPPTPSTTQGIVDKPTLSDAQRNLALDVFSDTRKSDAGIKLVTPDSIQAPNLPAGLTPEAISQVISDSNRAMSLCFAEAMRKGEKLVGKMEIQLSIEATGQVIDAQIMTPQFRTSQMGACTLRRVKTWRFPRFNGEPVTVAFPYVLAAGM
ncbi:MAG: AgmX/PglI C-terminal domain-containing protein [Myxococcota bacterium]